MRYLVIFLLIPLLSFSQKQEYEFSFTLNNAATVSAGVYNGEYLVRTLFSNRKLNAGTYNESWDGLDDDMQPAKSLQGLQVKVLSNNVKYEWEGVIGNTSEESSGPNIHRGFSPISAIAISGNKAYYSKFYSEGTPAQNYFLLNDIQRKNRLFQGEKKATSQATSAIATDGNLVYWAGVDPFGGKTKGSTRSLNYVFATTISQDKEFIFAKGRPYKNGIGRLQSSIIDETVVDGMHDAVSGMAVQRKGTLLFVSHYNSLHILNKTSGVILKNIPLNCGALAIDAQDNLWMVEGAVVNKYVVSPDGTLSRMLSINGFDVPVAMAVSPDNKMLLVADAGSSQQVKAFNNATGEKEWDFGQPGGYTKSAKVADDKFYFSDRRHSFKTSLAFGADGSFWLIDGGNDRLLHFTASRTLKEFIQYLPHSYHVYVDPKVPGRVFNDFLEFEIDYTKPLKPQNGSWKLVNNWAAMVDDQLIMKFMSFRPIKFSNGRTYTLMAGPEKNSFRVYELKADGQLRATESVIFNSPGKYIDANGDLYFMLRKAVGTPMIYTRQRLTGFNSNGDPQWGSTEKIASIDKVAPADPSFSGKSWSLRPGEFTSNKAFLVFDANGTGEGFHLGSIKSGDNKWLWRTARGTTEEYKGPYPSDGSYDIGNGVQYAGNVAIAMDKFLFWGYHGEFWKASQTNMWNMLNEDGLMIGQFGTTGPETGGQEAAAKMAGNVFAASVVKVGGNIYLYHNDEGHHSGVHRWKISNLESVNIVTVPLRSSNKNNAAKATAKSLQRAVPATSFLAGLPFNTVLKSGDGGWIISPSDLVSNPKNKEIWEVRTNVKVSDRFADPDIAMNFQFAAPAKVEVSKKLSFPSATSWLYSMDVSYDKNTPAYSAATNVNSGQFFELTDANDRVIVRLYPVLELKGKEVQIWCNGQMLTAGADAAFKASIADFNRFTCRYKNGKLLVMFGENGKEFTVSPADNNSNALAPAQLKFKFWNQSDKRPRRVISVKNIMLQ